VYIYENIYIYIYIYVNIYITSESLPLPVWATTLWMISEREKSSENTENSTCTHINRYSTVTQVDIGSTFASRGS
jgi:hypothetical protein